MSTTITVGIDLLPLMPDGANGGAKRIILAYLGWLAHGPESRRYVLVAFANNSTQIEIRKHLREKDKTVCILDLGERQAVRTHTLSQNDYILIDDAEMVSEHFPVDVLYAPFGGSRIEYPGVATVSMIHDLLHRDFPESVSNQALNHRERFFQRTIERSDFIHVNSNYTKSRVLHYYKFPTKRLKVGYPPVLAPPNTFSCSVNTRSTRPYYFYPANFWRHKNHHTLLQAYAIYCKRLSSRAWDLVLTGHDKKQNAIHHKLSQGLGIDSKVYFFGYATDSQLHRLWSGASALVFPSLHEGCGIPLMEAMHYGKPIVAHLGTAIPEICGPAGFLVDCLTPEPLADALCQVSSDDALRARLSQQSLDRSRVFVGPSPLATLENLLQIASRFNPTRLSISGVWSDGWFGNSCHFNLPRTSDLATIHLSLFPIPEPRELSITIQDTPSAHYKIPPHTEFVEGIEVSIGGQIARLQSDKTDRMSELDHRSLGMRVKSITFLSKNGKTLGRHDFPR